LRAERGVRTDDDVAASAGLKASKRSQRSRRERSSVDSCCLELPAREDGDATRLRRSAEVVRERDLASGTLAPGALRDIHDVFLSQEGAMAKFAQTGVWLAGALLAASCGGSDSVPPGTGAQPSDGGGGDGSPSGSDGGAVDAPIDLDAAPGASCPPKTDSTQGVHITMKVAWPGTIGTNPGSGNVHVWTRSKLTFGAGNTITAVYGPCGSVVPEVQTTPIAGGGKVLPEFPPAAWETAVKTTSTGTGVQSSFDVNSKVHLDASPVLVGLTMADPKGAWPALADVKSTDADGDGHPGITAVPRAGGGYSLPPTSLLQTAHADQLYIVSRTTTTLDGARDTCDSQKGTANVSAFDNHVIGCHIQGGGDCAAADYQFVDQNRTVYSVTSATFEAKVVPDNATCADVRAALPAP
jgi:hypothetical protein